MPGLYGQASMGTVLADGLRTGAVNNPQYTNNPGILNACIADPYIVVPSIPSATNLYPATIAAAAGDLVLVPVAPIVAVTGYNSSSTSFQGLTVYDLGVARVITVTSGAAATAFNMNVYGFDMYNNPVGETVTGVLNGPASTKKTYRYIYKIYISAGTTDTISVGTINTAGFDTLGLPFIATTFDTLVAVYWDQILQTIGDFTAADVSVATATTGDVRGKIAVPSIQDGTNKRLVVYQYLPGNQPPTATQTIAGKYGAPQFIPPVL